MGLTLHELCKAKYQRGGTDPQNGLDCKSLFVEAMNIFGNKVQVGNIEMLAVEEVVAALAREQYPYTDIDCSSIEKELKSGHWQKIDEPIEGCAVTMAIDSFKPDKIQHLGVYIGEGKFIHILEEPGVIISRIDDRYWRRKIKGFYKWLD